MSKPSIVSKIMLLALLGIYSCSKQNVQEPAIIASKTDLKAASTTVFGGTNAYVVFAWNDLGMHCLNPSYDKLVILPPYNNLRVQVVQRAKVPKVVTSGFTVSYSIDNNTYSYGKASFGQFWDYAKALFGVVLPKNIGLANFGLSGNMQVDATNNCFTATGIPVTPIYDNGTKDPYQVATITVKNSSGNVVATTKTTIPTSDEINCAKCHARKGRNAFDDILMKHDSRNGTNLVNSKPVLCANCHGSPALGKNTPGSSGKWLSQAIHGFHANKRAVCYDCHPGQTTKCNRSIRHTTTDGNCTTCHGSMANVASTITSGNRIPWDNEPSCSSTGCHASTVAGVNNGTALFRNNHGHGNLYCSACHGSPHAMIPSSNAKDNYQAMQYQGATRPVKSIGSCGICHSNSRGESSSTEFLYEHGGTSPKQKNACHTCHTEVTADKAKWPHAYTWTNSGGSSTGTGD